MKDGFKESCLALGEMAFLFKSFFAKHLPKPIFASLKRRPVRLRARTPPFHGGDTSSNLVRATKNVLFKYFAA